MLRRGSPTLVGMTLSNIPGVSLGKASSLPPTATPGIKIDEETTAAVQLLTNIAEKALALGRYDEAERVLSRVLTEMLTRARTGTVPAPARLSEATRYALKLAEGTKKNLWIDWIFDIHDATGKLIGGDEIEKLHETVRKLRYPGSAVMRRYIDKMREKQAELGPSERFLLQRLEGIQRVVSA